MTLERLQARIARFAPVRLGADLSSLPASERRALDHLVAAAGVFDAIFLAQVWPGNARLLLQLAADTSATGQAALRYFLMNKGPWSRLDGNEPFLDASRDVPAKPGQAGFYPADATRDEVETWLAGLPEAARAEATGFFTRIRRAGDGGLVSEPYSVAYRDELLVAKAHLEAAASATAETTLGAYLTARAEALLSNDYYASDLAWMHVDAALEPTIGPYETYEDEWFGYKAAFEAFVTVRDQAATARLARFGAGLQGLEDALPIAPAHRNARIGALAPIRVVNLVFAAGDGNRGVQTAAFNLPNDDRIIRAHGAKRVMLKNVQEAKFDRVLRPIAAVALAPDDQARVCFDAFFTHILLHELMHGLGPQQVTGTDRGVRLALADTYAAIEEAKADVSGLWALGRLADAGQVDEAVSRGLFATFLASAFRSLRFGLGEAHGSGVALQLNVLLEAGAVVVDGHGRFGVDDRRCREAVEALTGRIMTIQAEGDRPAAKALLAEYVGLRPEVRRVLDRLEGIPVDIAPEFDVG